MTTQKLEEALRRCTTGLQMPGENFLRVSLESVQAGIEALAAHEAEQEQAGEAVAVVYSISGQSQTEDAYATVQILNSAGKAYWDLPVKAGTKLYTRPQQPLSDEQAMAGAPPGITRHSYLQGFRDAERAHGIGITKEPKT